MPKARTFTDVRGFTRAPSPGVGVGANPGRCRAKHTASHGMQTPHPEPSTQFMDWRTRTRQCIDWLHAVHELAMRTVGNRRRRGRTQLRAPGSSIRHVSTGHRLYRQCKYRQKHRPSTNQVEFFSSFFLITQRSECVGRYGAC
eukprot:785645-Rhodomonas_salina.2